MKSYFTHEIIQTLKNLEKSHNFTVDYKKTNKKYISSLLNHVNFKGGFSDLLSIIYKMPIHIQNGYDPIPVEKILKNYDPIKANQNILLN